ncbi:GNAT family N-acetyltransferase [Tenacibaculum aestuariivivum]|uniref:GNAT family N-acetyltransferase n=1 Tax=Tenacibaculum aestuariivivum TaxID=2006131 RepID=UPI003AB69ECF
MFFLIKKFTELTTSELYEILQLRSEIFVVEQNCVYQDIDGKDQNALHVLGIKNKKIIAYTRIFNSGLYFKTPSIGRVVVNKNERKYGYGHSLLKTSIQAIIDNYNTNEITISAQVYLKKFYESHGFLKVGEGYIEDGIPHIKMKKE